MSTPVKETGINVEKDKEAKAHQVEENIKDL